MFAIAGLWITILLFGGGFMLDRVSTDAITQNFDSSLESVLMAMIRSSEIGPDGEVRLTQPLADPRFLEPLSGLYWQIDGLGHESFRSRSLWESYLPSSKRQGDVAIYTHNSGDFYGTKLRILERSVHLPDSTINWRFQVAENRADLDKQIRLLRQTLFSALTLLGVGLLILAALQIIYGLWPLRHIRKALAALRRGEMTRVNVPLPSEVGTLVEELNALLEHNERQAAEARTHAGNLAHALKTPLTVLVNAAASGAPDLDQAVYRETATMRRQVEHHLARARAVGRRSATQSRASVWESVESVTRAVARLYPHIRIDEMGNQTLFVRVERQDLDEMLGNLVENAAKYGGGSAFVTVTLSGDTVEIIVEDDGKGIAIEDRKNIFDRGMRIDSAKPGTGLGLAIVRDVVEIYGGSISLEKSEDMGGMLARLRLPVG